MARSRNTDDRRSQIVSGLRRAMAERGYEGATIAAIAEAASLTPGLVHYHFKNKQEILLELLRNLADVWGKRAATPATSGDPRTRLGSLIDAWLAVDDTADSDAVACWVTLGAEAVRQPEVRELYDSVLREGTAALENAVQSVLNSEGRRADQSRAIAAGLMASILGYLQMGIVTRSIVPLASAAGTLRMMAFGVIDAQPRNSERVGRS